MVDVPTNYIKLRLIGPGGEIETPWAEPVGEYFRLDNLPWFAYGVSDDDIVEATPTESIGVYEFVRVRAPSGNRLIRIFFSEPDDSQLILERLIEFGCHYEGLNAKLVAVSVPASIDLDSVCNYLTNAGATWEYANPTYEEVHRTKS